MASNVDLKRVREAVVAAIVEKIQVVQADAAAQRKEIVGVVQRWGPLIDRIGGIDAVETVEVLQVPISFYSFTPSFLTYDVTVPLCAVNTIIALWSDIGCIVPRGYCGRR